MKNILLLLLGVIVLASCSAPKKYSYNFSYYDYNSGKKKTNTVTPAVAQSEQRAEENLEATNESVLAIESETLVASSENNVVPIAKPVVEKSVLEKKYSDLSKSEKKAFRKELKEEIRKYAKAKKSDDGSISKETKALDYNLKMAIIFGAVALTLSFFGGVNSVFWILSVVALVIGVVFFIKWIAEQ
jgi:hypothetical protein